MRVCVGVGPYGRVRAYVHADVHADVRVDVRADVRTDVRAEVRAGLHIAGVRKYYYYKF